MYRRNKKTKYTKQYKDKELLFYVFDLTEPFELKFKKDVARFSVANILNMYKKLRCDRLTLFKIHAVLEDYSNCVFEQNNFSKVNIISIIQNDNTKMYTETDINLFARRLINPIDRVLIQAPFYGIYDYDEYKEISADAINHSDNSIRLKGKTVYLPEEVIGDIEKSLNTYVYLSPNSSYKLVGDGVIKFKETLNLYSESIRYYINNRYTRRYKKELDEDISYYKVCKSGIIHAAKVIKNQYNILDMKSLFIHPEFISKVTEQYKPLNVESIVREYRRDIFE